MRGWRTTLAIGAAQTIAWASTFYLPAVLGDPMAAELRIPDGWAFASLTIALVVSGAVAPRIGRAIDRAIGDRPVGPILLNRNGVRMDRHAATRRLRRLAATAGVRMPRMHPHMLRHTFITTMLDAGVSLRDVQIAARHADPKTTMRYDRARKNLDRHPTTSSPRSWPPEPDNR